jgi:hypothetical protein
MLRTENAPEPAGAESAAPSTEPVAVKTAPDVPVQMGDMWIKTPSTEIDEAT